MSKKHLLFLPIFLLLLQAPAYADLAQESYEHARSAFTFAERRNWADATLHAERTENVALGTLIKWLYYLDGDSGASFAEITQFMGEHPKWPEQKKLRIRAELALKDNTTSDNDIIAWFGSETPITGIGKLALAEALKRQSLSNENHINGLIRDAWINGDFDDDTQKRILADYGSLLTQNDHLERINRLLWEEKVSAAEDILSRAPAAHRKLYDARIALIRDKKNAATLVGYVPNSLAQDAGLEYDRMRYRAKRKDDHGVRDILLKQQDEMAYPEKWWDFRETQIRKALDEGNYKLASRLLANHGLKDGSDYADAIWLKGWIELEFLKNPKIAYDIFYRMYENVRFPVSKARAAYWAGRAAEKGGDRSAANGWFNTASAYPTTFYGQLASLKYHGTAPLRIPAQPSIGSIKQYAFDKSDIAQAAVICSELGRNDLAGRLISGMIENASDEDEAAMSAALGKEMGQTYLSVRGAKKALQYHNAVLIKSGYPTPKTPYDAAIERPLVLAITRQESEFDPMAKSPANALGMMQLLPSTAREVARKNDIGYSLPRLYETDYNWTLGSLYLNRMINSYSGSYLLAIASYNAGPGNVRKWINQFGTPGDSVESAVMWIEKIPFSETRNYVQRVLENLQVYRHILAENEAPKLRLGEDMVR